MRLFRSLFGSGRIDVQLLGLGDQIVQIRRAQRASLLEYDLLVLDHHQGRHGLHFGGGGEIRILVDIDLREINVRIRFACLFERRAERTSRTAPGCPEIHEYQIVGFDDLIEILRSDRMRCHDCSLLFVPSTRVTGYAPRMRLLWSI